MYYDAEEDVLWIATFSEGIVRIGISQNTFDEIPLHTPIQNIAKILPLDKENLILCSTIDGLYKLDKHSMKISSQQTRFGLNNIGIINDIALNANILWMCTDYQVLKVDINKGYITKRYSTDTFPGMLGEHTNRCLYCDKYGRLWVGTSGAGIFTYDPDTDAFINCTSGKYKGNNFINNIVKSYIDTIFFSKFNSLTCWSNIKSNYDSI